MTSTCIFPWQHRWTQWEAFHAVVTVTLFSGKTLGDKDVCWQERHCVKCGWIQQSSLHRPGANSKYGAVKS